ncbi:hypothetical protein GCM10012287_09880 [Streptomyces daqingensis]|uniref:Uncharacterized protein n=1 Tax=Streptomyces daqingensis TaxID=1472640 RepID=A0ABQ2LXL9_9ACTN|nr:hypothetical protein GCM10012287_09880 [Streptomyces daqingensis]
MGPGGPDQLLHVHPSVCVQGDADAVRLVPQMPGEELGDLHAPVLREFRFHGYKSGVPAGRKHLGFGDPAVRAGGAHRTEDER